MKKFLLAIIMLIPMIVVIALGATSSIIAAAKDVNATSIEVRDEYNELIVNNSQLNMSINSEGITVFITVLPTITYDDSVTYEMSADSNYTGEVKMQRIGSSNEYRILPVKSGPARIIIRASNNREVYQALNIYILSNEIDNIVIYDNFGTTVSNDMDDSNYPEYMLTTNATLYALVYPLDAMLTNHITWECSDDSVLEITQNGTMSPLKRGKALVSVTVMQKTGAEISSYIIVNTEQAVLKTTTLYSSNKVDESYIASNVVVGVSDSEVLATLDIAKTSGGYMVTLGGYSEKLYVYDSAEGAFDFYDVPDVMYTNSGDYTLNCKLLEGVQSDSLAGVEYKIIADNTGIADVVNGKLVPYLSGKITLVATYNDMSISKDITIYNKPRAFSMSLGQEDGELGIEMTRVWGFNWYTDSKYKNTTNTYQLHTDLQEGDVDLRWFSSNAEWATVDATGLVTFNTAGAGQSIKITAKVYANNYPTGVERSFTFNMTEEINSYNIGSYTTNDDAEKDANALELNAAARSGVWGNTIVLQGNINFYKRIYISANLYGNGFTIDGKNYQQDGTDEIMLYVRSEAAKYMERDAIYVQNVTISGAASHEESQDMGFGLRVQAGDYEFNLLYSVVRYVNTGVMVSTAYNDVNFKGCVLGDGTFVAVNITTKNDLDHTIAFTDCVFKSTGGPSVTSTTANPLDDSKYLNVNTLPNLEFNGFIDIYNWKEVSDLASIVGSLDAVFSALDDYNIDPAQVTSLLGSIFEEVFLQEANSNAVYYYENESGKVVPYVSLGFIAIGCFVNNDETRISMADSGLEMVSIKMPDKNDKSTIATLLSIADGLVKAFVNSEMTVYHPSQLVTYNIDADGGPRNNPDDPVPQNTELYYKLNGKDPIVDNKGEALRPEIAPEENIKQRTRK